MSSAATSKPDLQGDKFSSRINKYSSSEFKALHNDDNLVGSGSYGNVRKYYQKDKIVVIKEFATEGDDAKITKIWNLVINEANILCRFRHENIVKILGITQWHNIIGIIMEYIDGGNLQSVLSEDNHSKLPWNTRLEIAKGIVSALDYIHNYGEKKTFCHGDLKTENVLLTSELQVKLADFGSAVFYRVTGASTTTISNISSTQYSLNYVAPEFFEDTTGTKSPAMDIYSFAMVLYELICGKVPYSDCKMPHFLVGVIAAKIKPTIKLVDDVASQLESDDRSTFSYLKTLMMRCWNNDPALRPSSKTVKSELDSGGTTEQISSFTAQETCGDGFEAVANERAASTVKTFTQEDVKPSTQKPTASPCLFRDDKQSTSLADSPKQTFHEKETFKKTANRADFVSPKQAFFAKGNLQESTKVSGLSTLVGNNASIGDFLEMYVNSLLKKNYEQAKECKAALRLLIVNNVNATAKEVERFADKLLEDKKYLQSVAVFDTAAALFAKLKNPEKDFERIQFCVQGMKAANEGMVENNINTKVVVRVHVLPLMRDWLREMKGIPEIPEKWRCYAVSWVLSNIESCESLVDQKEERKQTIEEALRGMRKVFGCDVHRLHGRLYGNLLNHLGLVYNSDSRFEAAAAFFKEAREAHKVAEDYFGDEEDKEDDIRISETNLQSNLRDAWEQQMKIK